MKMRRVVAWVLVAAAVLAISTGCGGSDRKKKKKNTDPEIYNINGASDPASPVLVSIEINGVNFGDTPGEVHFTDALDPANVQIIIPLPAAWNDSGIVVQVPDAGAVGLFPVPGVVTVEVLAGGVMSNAIDLSLVDTPSFSPSNVTWQASTALPVALRGLGAVPVRVDDTSAFVVVVGGNTGVGNVTAVYRNTLNQDGTLGASWTTETNTLPFARAYHGTLQSNPQNAPLLNLNDRYLYVLGGQEDSAATPGGVDTVYMARVFPSTGIVGVWSQTTALPEPLLAPAVTLYNGYIYLLGGLRPDGNPSDIVATVRVRDDGTLGTWSVSAYPLPTPTAFGSTFAFGGRIYFLCGDPVASTDPNEQATAGADTVWSASALRGDVGDWTVETTPIKQRKKHIVWASFGQIILCGGVYNGGAGSSEMERSAVLPAGILDAWNGMTGGAIIGADVFNAAGFVSPIRVVGGAPRFLLFGGEQFTGGAPGAIVDTVHYNDAP